MKIGVFLGSFNPVHIEHINLGEKLISDGYVDKIIYIPVGNFYNKKGLAEANHRYNMLEIATSHNSNLNVSDMELNKEKQNYTYETLDELKKLYPLSEIYLIIGSDNLNEFASWKNYEYILTNYKVISMDRDNQNDNLINNIFNKYKDNIIGYIDGTVSPVSSTVIRNEIIKGVKPEFINDEVYKYIEKNKLYK
jgi:nicotinate-nucleotide adenylyltransferase